MRMYIYTVKDVSTMHVVIYYVQASQHPHSTRCTDSYYNSIELSTSP